MSIVKDELLKVLKDHPEYQKEYTSDISKNLDDLLVAINEFRNIWGKPMIVNSGWRPVEYNKKIGGAPNSNHCKGLAVDISDPDGTLADYATKNVEVLKDCGLWCEDTGSTKGWVHFQCVPPKSGKRFFKP